VISNNNIDKNFLSLKKNKILSTDFQNTFKEILFDINNDHKTLHILNKSFSLNLDEKNLKKFKKFKDIVIIGMGGSILGSEAIYSFLEKKIKKNFYFFNDLNENKILKFKKNKNLKKTLFIIISKSGNTIETLSNTLFLKIIRRNAKNIIVISEENNNFLFNLSKKMKLFYIKHKEYVGGRYSVLSEVGMIPAYLMGLSVSKLRSKTFEFLSGKKKLVLKNSSITLANLLKSKKIRSLIFLNYFPELENFLIWYQQLIAESLGKKNKGFLPVISNVPKDHHSLLQLYLDGPKDKLFYIFSSNEKQKENIINNKASNGNNYLNQKRLCDIKNAQKNALIKVLKTKKIPFREFKITKKNEQILSELFSYFMLETALIGKLLKINPFNQPAVEKIKIITKKFLTEKNQK
tara:strand:- start:320 stop:1537 length:1218 start_codon:yes stop_codon:yes gene_type:complete